METKLLEDYNEHDRFKIITKTTEIFPKENRIEVSNKQIKNLIEIYKSRVFFLGNLKDNIILQIIAEGFNKNGDGKIVLGNLKDYKLFFPSLNYTIGNFVEKQQEYYKRIIIEACLHEGFRDSLINNGFKPIKDLSEVKKILQNFIPKKDSFKYEDLKELEQKGKYVRIGGYNGEIKFIKEMFIRE